MNNRKRADLINDIDYLIFKWCIEKSIFSGGCLFVAACVSEVFESLGIKYELITLKEANKSMDFMSVCKSGMLIHAALRCTIDGEKMIIGGGSYFNTNIPGFHSRRRLDVSSKEMMNIYQLSNWNKVYRTSNNQKFKDELFNVVNKYF